MHQTKKGNQWHFGMKAHIGVDLHSGLVHTVVDTAANEHDVTQAAALLHGDETLAFGDAGYQGADKRPELQGRDVTWYIAMRPGKRRALGNSAVDRLTQKIERAKSSLRAKVEHPFRVIKCQVRVSQGALPWAGQEHNAFEDAVYAVQYLDGAPPVDGGDRISAPKKRQQTRLRA